MCRASVSRVIETDRDSEKKTRHRDGRWWRVKCTALAREGNSDP